MASVTWNVIFQDKVQKLNKPDSWSMEFDDAIEAKRSHIGWKEYIRNPFSRFTCSICHHSWASSKSMVVFHMRLDSPAHNGVVKVRRYKQNCKTCEGATFEEPSVDPKDLDDMMDKLIEKILVNCYGQESSQPKFFRKKVLKGDHLSKHCEACQKGVCDQR
ncbi:receptor-transporting protein 2-like [Scleropages formosus]|uniref:Receptor-transporting protein 2-like n=1 Tax=Scleropages formosus TaxID=113540 RepID=A0A8C9TK92_SCLFO|nr:receptor-transporting protein 2-like [Scleropages formosus]